MKKARRLPYLSILFTCHFVGHLVCHPQAQALEPYLDGYKALVQKVTTYVKKDGTATTTTKEVFKVTTLKGAVSMSNYKIAVYNTSSKFELVDAQVQNEKMEFHTQPSKVQRLVHQTPGLRGGMSETAEYVVPLKQVKVGSVVTITYRLKESPILPGIFGHVAQVTNAFFADEESQTVISELPLKEITQGFEDLYLMKKFEKDGKFVIEVTPTEKARMLAGKEDKIASFFVTSAASWSQINKRLAVRYNMAVNGSLPKEFKAIVASAKRLKMPGEKIERVAEGLQSLITYSGDWRTTKGKFFPAGHRAVVKSGRGDCKDYSTSMVALLRRLGFESYVALSFRRSGAAIDRGFMKEMSEFPTTLAFNHAIVWAKDPSGKMWWVDPTNPKVTADILSSDILGNFALVLNGVDDETRPLPEKNKNPWIAHLDQTIEVKADNSVKVTSHQEYNDTAYNDLSILERQFGTELMTKGLIGIVDPYTEGEGKYKFSTAEEKNIYDLEFTASDWTREEVGRSFSVTVSSPLSWILRFGKKSGSLDRDLGQESHVTAKTLLKGKKALDPIDHDCLLKSPWFDFERVVKVTPEGTEFFDRLDVKKRYVSHEELEGKEFEQLWRDADGCEGAASILLSLNPSQKTALEIELDKLKGPAVEKLTEKDVRALEAVNNVNLHGYILRKLYRYYSNRILEDEKDVKAYAERALLVRRMGYLYGDKYASAYLESALEDLKKAEAVDGASLGARFFYAKVLAEADLGKMKEALEDFKRLKKKAPQSYEFTSAGYYMNSIEEKFPIAEKWLKVALTRASRPEQKRKARAQMADLLADQKKYSQSLQEYGSLLKDHPESALEWHNAAIVLYQTKDFDRCIEFEKRALGISEFKVAKQTLADALVAKAKVKKSAGNEQRMTLLLSALKWDPENIEAHYELSEVYAKSFTQGKDSDGIKKAKESLAKIMAVEPENELALQKLKEYNSLEKSRAISSEK